MTTYYGTMQMHQEGMIQRPADENLLGAQLLVDDVSNLPSHPDEADAQLIDMEEDFCFFQNVKMRRPKEALKAAEKLPLSTSKKCMALMAIASMVFNVYVVVNNFVAKPDFDNVRMDIQNAKLIVFWAELIIVMSILSFGLFYLCVAMTCLRTRTYVGQHCRYLSRIVNTVSSFSLVKGSAYIKGYATYVMELWAYSASKRDQGGIFRAFGAMCECVGYGGLRFFIVTLSVVAFLLKLTQISFVADTRLVKYTYSDWIAFLGFLNNMISLYNPYMISQDTIWKFMFAGNDSLYTSNELKVRDEFQECLYYHLMRPGIMDGSFLSVLGGLAKVITLSPHDIQWILLHETHVIKDAGEIADDAFDSGTD